MDFNRIVTGICGLIPGKIDDRLVLEVYDLIGRTEQFFRKEHLSSLSNNTAAFLYHLPSMKKAGGYIEDQHNYRDMSYGVSTMMHAGCEIFAVYNALYTLNGKHTIPLPEMIREFEKEGMVLSGRFGTSPKALVQYLNRNGYKTEMVIGKNNFDALGPKYRALILTMYNNAADIRDEIHTIHISRDAAGFTAHNVYCNGSLVGPSKTISDLILSINKGKARGICLIGVKK
ncbi:MAG: hypothetical protein MJ116_01230 [Lachnospiraceae bacterium]|nr:hypothetical protein [Lachnospiraceae bacterium]